MWTAVHRAGDMRLHRKGKRAAQWQLAGKLPFHPALPALGCAWKCPQYNRRNANSTRLHYSDTGCAAGGVQRCGAAGNGGPQHSYGMAIKHGNGHANCNANCNAPCNAFTNRNAPSAVNRSAAPARVSRQQAGCGAAARSGWQLYARHRLLSIRGSQNICAAHCSVWHTAGSRLAGDYF